MKNQKGFAVIEGLLILVIVGLIGFVGWYVYSNKSSANSLYNKAASESSNPVIKGQYSALKPEDIAKLKASSPTPTAPTPTSNPTVKTPVKSSPPPAPAPAPSPPPSPTVIVTVSADGCYVTATANVSPGATFEVGAFSGNKGGSTKFNFPASGTITKATGGFKGMTAFGEIDSASGIKIGYGSGTITADSCPPS